MNPCTVEEFRALSRAEKDEFLDEMVKEIRKINVFPIYYFNEEGIYKEIQEAINKKVTFTGDKLEIFYF